MYIFGQCPFLKCSQFVLFVYFCYWVLVLSFLEWHLPSLSSLVYESEQVVCEQYTHDVCAQYRTLTFETSCGFSCCFRGVIVIERLSASSIANNVLARGLLWFRSDS